MLFMDKTKNKESEVAKSNELIRKSRHSLTLREQQILYLLMNRIDRDDKEFFKYEFELSEICHELEIIQSSGQYKHLKSTLKGMRDKSFWHTLPNGNETLIGWLKSVTISQTNNKVTLQLDDQLAPFLLELQDNYTVFNPKYITKIKSSFTPPLYEWLKLFANTLAKKGIYKFKKEMKVQDLRYLLNCTDKLTLWAEFKRNALELALDDINSHTDLSVVASYKKTGRNITEVEFLIVNKAKSKSQSENVIEAIPVEVEEQSKEEGTTPNAVEFYKENFDTFTPFEIKEIKKWVETFSEEIVIEAIKRSINYNKKFWNYIEQILNTWLKEGVETLEDTQKSSDGYRAKKQAEYEKRANNLNNKGTGGKPKRTEIVPEWMKEGHVKKEEQQRTPEEQAEFEKRFELVLAGKASWEDFN